MLEQLLSPVANQVLKLISQRFNRLQPRFSEMLGKYVTATFLIDCSDLPVNLLFSFPNNQLLIQLTGIKATVTSTIRGKSEYFLQLLKKNADSDALFFQQKLIISGDMEASTAFRNCLERIDFDLLQFLSPINNPLVDKIIAKIHAITSNKKTLSVRNNALELVCPAGNPQILRTAIDAGADAVYFGFNKHGNARNFAGLNFSYPEVEEALTYVHSQGRKMLAAINAYPQAQNIDYVKETIATAASLGVDAVILADIGMLDYATTHHPQLHRHLSVQASAGSSDALQFYAREFGIKRVILPRILDFQHIKDITAAAKELDVEVEIFGFGGLCVMAEGRCSLSGYLTGKSPNMHGVCSPAEQISYVQQGDKLQIKLNQFTINEFKQRQTACYPTICKGSFNYNGQSSHLFEEPTSLSLLTSLKTMLECGVKALKIEGRQRSNAYVRQVVSTFRYAVDHLESLSVADFEKLNLQLQPLMEGANATEGAYREQWN